MFKQMRVLKNDSTFIHHLGMLSHVQLFATPRTIGHQAPLPLELYWQEYWNGLSFPPPGDLPSLGIEPKSPVAPALAGKFLTTEPPG